MVATVHRMPPFGLPFSTSPPLRKTIENKTMIGTGHPPSDPYNPAEIRHEPSGQFVRSLERGLDVIKAFDADHPSMTLSEVARRVDLTRASARRFLLTLIE